MKQFDIGKKLKVSLSAVLLTGLGMTYSQSLQAQTFDYDGLTYQILTENTVGIQGFAANTVLEEGAQYSSAEIIYYNDIEYTVTEVLENAFAGNPYLIAFGLPNTIEKIGSKAFANCTNMGGIGIGGYLKSIGDSAFEGCNIYGLDLPASLVSIGNNAFSSNTELWEVRCSALVPPTCGTNVFSGTIVENQGTLTVYDVETYKNTAPWNTFRYFRTLYPAKSLVVEETEIEVDMGDLFKPQITTVPEVCLYNVEYDLGDNWEFISTNQEGELYANVLNDISEPKIITITARVEGEEGTLEAPFQVKINPVTFELPTKELILPAGWAYQNYVNPMETNYDDYTWSVQNENIAFVNENGLLITTGSLGSTQVQLSYQGEIVKSYPLTVISADGQPSLKINNYWENPDYFTNPGGIYINSMTELSDGKYQLNAGFIWLQNASKLTWTSSNPEVATINQQGQVTILDNTSVVTFTVTSANGLTASYDYIPEDMRDFGNGELLDLQYVEKLPNIAEVNIGWWYQNILPNSSELNIQVSFNGGDLVNIPASIVTNDKDYYPRLLTADLSDFVAENGNGQYIISIPAGLVKNSNNEINLSQTWTLNVWPVVEKEYTITPEPGGEYKPHQLGEVKIINGDYNFIEPNWSIGRITIVNTETGEESFFENVGPNGEFVSLDLSYLEEGTYQINIPEGYFVQDSYKLEEGGSLSQFITFSYTVLPGMPYGVVINPQGGEYQTELSEVQIQWDVESIQVVSESDKYIYGWVNGDYYELGNDDLNISGNILTIDFSEYSLTAGSYVEIQIPSGLLVDNNDDYNRAQHFNFQIRDLIDEYTVTPKAGEYTIAELNDIRLNWGMDTMWPSHNDNMEAYVVDSEGNKTILEFSYSNTSAIRLENYELVVNLSGLEPDTYTLVLPQGYLTIHDEENDIYYINSEISIEYTIEDNLMAESGIVTYPENYKDGMEVEYLSYIDITFDSLITYYNWDNTSFPYNRQYANGNYDPDWAWTRILDSDGNEIWEDSESKFGTTLRIGIYQATASEIPLTIPAGLVKNEKGNLNQVMTLDFNITGVEMPDPIITPEVGELEDGLFTSFTISFGDYQADVWEYDAKERIIVTYGSEFLILKSVEHPEEEKEEDGYIWTDYDLSSYIFTLEDPQNGVGEYNISIPANLFTLYVDGCSFKYTEPIEFTYTINEPGVLPEPFEPTLNVSVTEGTVTSLPQEILLTWSSEEVAALPLALSSGISNLSSVITFTVNGTPQTGVTATVSGESSAFADGTGLLITLPQAYSAAGEYVINVPKGVVSILNIVEDSVEGSTVNDSVSLTYTIEAVSGDDQPGDDQPGDDQPGDDQPGDDQPGEDQPGDDEPGNNPGDDNQPGEDQPGDDEPGNNPGGEEPGDGPSGIAGVIADPNGLYHVYTISGMNVITTKDAAKVKELENGIYIINGKKVMLKK